ncbi:hypothetical protein [Candidatus Albibeggiatoa sp. nov. BB20]|uniref:hypothetical protein n=1 Tax=Candidatus Albibeggiatoa sp. nov. BB20 TaxID=3162723 RepID=UPI00336578CE
MGLQFLIIPLLTYLLLASNSAGSNNSVSVANSLNIQTSSLKTMVLQNQTAYIPSQMLYQNHIR